HPNQRARRCGRIARCAELCVELPVISWIEAGWTSASENGSAGGDGGSERGRAVRQGTGVSASVAAILSSVATLSCCLPLGLAAALGAGAASAFFTTLRPWLLGVSVVSIGVGFWQQHRARQCAARGRVVGTVLLWVAVGVVVAMVLFPQEIAALIADGLGGK